MPHTLEWPGELKLSYVIIDPSTNLVLDADLPLLGDCQKLNTSENKYVNVSKIFDLFSGQIQDDAKWVLQELLERFNVKQLINITSKMSETTTYLPISTLLAFIMLWPCGNEFHSLYTAIHQFLENSSESLCHNCGWTMRECSCNTKHSENHVKTFLGYGRSCSDASCQTDSNEPESNGCLHCNGNSATEQVLNMSPPEENTIMSNQNAVIQDDKCHTHEDDNTQNIQENDNIISSHSALVNSSVNHAQPLSSNENTEPTNEFSTPNVFNPTSRGFHGESDKSLKRKRSRHCNDNEPRTKKSKHIQDSQSLSSDNIRGEKGTIVNQDCSPGAPKMILNLRGAGDKNGESSFWRLMDDLPPGGDGERTNLAEPLGKMFKRFRHTVFGDVVLRCFIQNCGQCFDTEKAAEFHKQAHTTETSPQNGVNGDHHHKFGSLYKCTECPFKLPFSQWHDMLRHMETSHGLKISNGLNSCNLCGLNFEDKDGLDHHMEFHSNSHYRCMYCGITLFSWHQVEMHLGTCGKRLHNQKDQKLDMGCPYCSTVFQKKNFRKIHLMSHTDEGLTCMFCEDRIPRTWKALKKHYDMKHAKQVRKFNSLNEKSLNWNVKERRATEIPCEKCSFVTTSESFLKIHMSKKHTPSEYSCIKCDMKFVGRRQLKLHMTRHACEMTSSCDRHVLNQVDQGNHVHRHQSDGFKMFSDYHGGHSRDSRSSISKKSQGKKPEIANNFLGPTDFFREIVQFNEDDSDIFPNGSSVGKRGRKRKQTGKDVITVEEKREKMARSQKDIVDKMNNLLKASSARTRTYKDFKIIKNLNLDTNEIHCDINDSRLTSSPSISSVNDDVISLLPVSVANRYPYLEHSYCKTEISVPAEQVILPTPISTHKNSKSGKKSKPVIRAPSPDIAEASTSDSFSSAFPLRTTRRQAAIAANKEQVSSCYAPPDIISSIVSVHNPLDDLDLDSMTSKMTESELLAELELLKGQSDYSFMQDILTSLSPSKNKKAASVCGFVAPQDLDSIELSDEDFKLITETISENDLKSILDQLDVDDSMINKTVDCSSSSKNMNVNPNLRGNGKMPECYT